MRNLFIALLVVTTLCLTATVSLASTDTATALVTVTVNVIAEWATDFATIDLAPITAQGTTPSKGKTVTLYTNGNLVITADNTSAAKLKLGTDPNQTLVTSYMLTDDGDGSSTTGGADEVAYTGYATFLTSGGGYAITHKAGDGDDVITLNAKAANPPASIADAGNYTATQTLTATW
jgi:hypothetical protein